MDKKTIAIIFLGTFVLGTALDKLLKKEEVPVVVASIQTRSQLYELTDVEVIDGDTIKGTIELPWDISIRQQSIRALGYDACESSFHRQAVKVTDAEIKIGKLAKQDLIDLIKTGDLCVSPGSNQRDNYGRILAYLVLRKKDGTTIDLDNYMIKKGYDRSILNTK